MSGRPVLTAYDWVPDFARGQVRDLRVRWALEEIGQPYDVAYLAQGTQKREAHRALNPYGQVPTYAEGELVLFESGAIVLHLARIHRRLLPDDPGGAARASEWLFAALNTVEPPIADHATATIFEAHEPWSRARLPGIEARVRQRLAETAARLGEREWYDGDFSVGDLMMVSVLRLLRDDVLLAGEPTLAAYVARGQARPAFARALAGQMAGFTGAPPPGFDRWRARLAAAQGADT
ncbi:glutathione S-transferase family protein [Sphingomonas sp. Leaf4]|uniref:glutathione S-transferase family protein n=1 Tax=Sphingomonas sp. Leaf4 TaxID=2876553 RepID=UPI001E564D25|nr:glutathione S-transferase family protein [Sphingomonas sp. Leaf4]